MSPERGKTSPVLTPAEREALAYVAGLERIWSSALHGLYERRYRAECEAEGRAVYIGSARRGAWKRTSGAVLSRLQRKGFLMNRHWSAYDRSYSITDEGLKALHDAKD